MAYYPKTIQEEELKNKVREDWFTDYDNTEIPGKVDFCVGHNGTTYLWAEAMRGVKKDIYAKLHAALRKAHKLLAKKIVPKGYEHGFLR